jgi:Protein of unknown function, DUF488
MQISEFDAGLHRLMKLAGQKRSAIMCADAVPWRCHRSLIADALTVRGIRVDDIMSTKRPRFIRSLLLHVPKVIASRTQGKRTRPRRADTFEAGALAGAYRHAWHSSTRLGTLA